AEYRRLSLREGIGARRPNAAGNLEKEFAELTAELISKLGSDGFEAILDRLDPSFKLNITYDSDKGFEAGIKVFTNNRVKDYLDNKNLTPEDMARYLDIAGRLRQSRLNEAMEFGGIYLSLLIAEGVVHETEELYNKFLKADTDDPNVKVAAGWYLIQLVSARDTLISVQRTAARELNMPEGVLPTTGIDFSNIETEEAFNNAVTAIISMAKERSSFDLMSLVADTKVTEGANVFLNHLRIRRGFSLKYSQADAAMGESMIFKKLVSIQTRLWDNKAKLEVELDELRHDILKNEKKVQAQDLTTLAEISRKGMEGARGLASDAEGNIGRSVAMWHDLLNRSEAGEELDYERTKAIMEDIGYYSKHRARDMGDYIALRLMYEQVADRIAVLEADKEALESVERPMLRTEKLTELTEKLERKFAELNAAKASGDEMVILGICADIDVIKTDFRNIFRQERSKLETGMGMAAKLLRFLGLGDRAKKSANELLNTYEEEFNKLLEANKELLTAERVAEETAEADKPGTADAKTATVDTLDWDRTQPLPMASISLNTKMPEKGAMDTDPAKKKFKKLLDEVKERLGKDYYKQVKPGMFERGRYDVSIIEGRLIINYYEKNNPNFPKITITLARDDLEPHYDRGAGLSLERAMDSFNTIVSISVPRIESGSYGFDPAFGETYTETWWYREGDDRAVYHDYNTYDMNTGRLMRTVRDGRIIEFTYGDLGYFANDHAAGDRAYVHIPVSAVILDSSTGAILAKYTISNPNFKDRTAVRTVEIYDTAEEGRVARSFEEVFDLATG
ncbi:MAG: hypothetical protein ABH875_04190, partial [Candidatus Omnitrophota bacterium]